MSQDHPHGDEQPEDVLDPTLADDLAEALVDVDLDALSEETTEETAAEPTLADQLAERTEDLQRITAEYANFRRRTAQERDGIITSAKAQVLTSLLPILDDLDLAEKHGDLAEGPLKAFRDKFVSTVAGLKVEAFGVEGDLFDAERHEAVQDLSTGDDKAIGTVLRKGYEFNGRLLRTAMVIIADPRPTEDAEADATESDSESEA